MKEISELLKNNYDDTIFLTKKVNDKVVSTVSVTRYNQMTTIIYGGVGYLYKPFMVTLYGDGSINRHWYIRSDDRTYDIEKWLLDNNIKLSISHRIPKQYHALFKLTFF